MYFVYFVDENIIKSKLNMQYFTILLENQLVL